MRIVASIYLAIALADFGFWLANGLQHDIFPTPYYYLTWSLYLFSLLSLLGFILRKLLFPQRVWQVVFVVYLTTRAYELITRGLPLGEAGFSADLNIIFSYLWLVLPACLAMWYLGFVFPNPHSGIVDHKTQAKSDHQDEPGQVIL